MNEKTKGMGIIVSGLVMAKNEYPGKDGRQPRYALDIAIPGQKENLSVTVPPEEYHKINLLDSFKAAVSYSVFRGSIYWRKAA